MKELFSVCLSGMLVCCVLAASAQGTITSGIEEWAVTLQPGESFTCVAYYVPDVDPLVIPVPESLIFPDAPEGTSTYWFGWEASGWQTALSEDNRIAYLYGPQITNNSANPWTVFSFELAYQWDEADVVDYPVYNDFIMFDGETSIYEFAWRGTPGGTWGEPNEITFLQQYDPASDPYTNPVPGPATLSLFGFGLLFLRKKRRV